ncbi:hypothetical protein ACWGCW_25875 [Streptomyces sp. NPDC054933]
MLLLAGLCTAVTLVGHAYGAPTPTPSPSATAGPAPSTSSSPPPSTPSASPSAAAKPPDKKLQGKAWQRLIDNYKKSSGTAGGVLGAFAVTDKDNIPITAYTIDEDTGDWKAWDLKLDDLIVNGLFLGVEWCVAFACWLIAWSLSFSLAKILLGPVLSVSDSLYTNVIVAIGVPGVCLTFAGVTAAYHFMFGNRARGWAELAASLLISALSITVLAAPPQLLLGTNGGAVGKTRDFAVAAGSLVLGNNDAGFNGHDAAAALARPITDALTDTFVIQPAELLTYGQTFDDACDVQFRATRIAEAVWQQQVSKTKQQLSDDMSKNPITNPLAGLPFGQDIDSALTKASFDYVWREFGQSDPNQQFEKHCVTGDAGAAKKASLRKAGDAFFVLIAAILTCAFVIGVDAIFLTSQAWIAWEAMVARCALAIGVLPGPGRSMLWGRAASIARALVLMIASIIALAIFIVVVSAIMAARPNDIPGGLTGRFVITDLLCVAALVFRKRLVRASHRMATNLRNRLGESKMGGRAPATLGSPPRRSLLRGALMLGAVAATGGGSALYGARVGRRGLVRALGSGLSATGRFVGRAGTRGAKAGVTVGKFGLRATVGLPVYGPRAARATATAARALPQTAQDTATALRQRLTDAHGRYAPPVRDFADEYWRGIGGRWITNRIRGRNASPAPQPTPARRRRPRPGGPTARPTTGLRPTAPPPGPRPRLAPPRTPAPAASAQQAALQQRLHRIRARRAAAAPRPMPMPPPAPRPAPPRRPAPRRRRGGRP